MRLNSATYPCRETEDQPPREAYRDIVYRIAILLVVL